MLVTNSDELAKKARDFKIFVTEIKINFFITKSVLTIGYQMLVQQWV